VIYARRAGSKRSIDLLIVSLIVVSGIGTGKPQWEHKTFYEGFVGLDDGKRSEGPWVTLNRIRSDIDIDFPRDVLVRITPELRYTTSHDLLPDRPEFQRQEFLDWRRTFRARKNSRGELFVDRFYAFWQASALTRVTVGKQRISWGTGFVFSPMDIFNPLPPQDIFTPERRGVDAVRIQHRTGRIRAEAVYAFLDDDRRAAAVRAGFVVGAFDTAITGGRLTGSDFYGAETSGNIASFGLRAEYLNREGQSSFLISIDHRIGEENLIEIEYYRNGFGSADPRRYPFYYLPLLRGEIPALARKYFALSGRKQFNPLEALEVTLSFNEVDEGLYANPRYIRSLSDESEMVVGGQLFWGSPPAEFAAFSNIYYVRLTRYFSR